jgi:REP element-mobilizing transposase RayT
MKQLTMKLNGWGGRRAGAGRPRLGKSPGVAHRLRERFAARFPIHVTVRVTQTTWNLRSRRSFKVIERAFWRGQGRFGVRLIHFAVMGNHLHLIVEAPGANGLSRGIKGLGVRIAKGLNRMMSRRGQVVAERYHAHVLRTPSETRRALHYVLTNHEHHFRRPDRDYTSLARPDLVIEPQTWLLTRAPPPT